MGIGVTVKCVFLCGISQFKARCSHSNTSICTNELMLHPPSPHNNTPKAKELSLSHLSLYADGVAAPLRKALNLKYLRNSLNVYINCKNVK
jgi:hypothetical protein